MKHTSYDMIQSQDGKWTLRASRQTVKRGSLKEIVETMISDLDFQMSEIEFAVEQMEACVDNSAHFGMNRTFMFTRDLDSDKVSA
jgi:hypothetical protein